MALPRYTLRQLEAFCHVADTLSFTVSGERLGLTPSAVSQLVSELEVATGFRLFERSTRRVALTAAGREFLASADSVLRHLRLAEQAAADVRNRALGLVRVAAPMVLASAALPGAIAAYRKTHPHVVVRICDTTVEGIVGLIEQGDADLGVGPDRASGAQVSREALFESPWVLWCDAGHPLAEKRRVRWSDLEELPLLAAGRDHERVIQQAVAGGSRVTGQIQVVENISTALGLSAAGLGATLSPAYVGTLARGFGLLEKALNDPAISRAVSLYRPSVRTISSAAEGFASFLQQHLRDWEHG